MTWWWKLLFASKHALTSRFDIDRTWRVVPGRAYGVRHPVLLACARVEVARALPLDALDNLMQSRLEEGLPVGLSPENAGVALAWRVLQWSAIMQRQHKIPLFDAGRIVSVNAGNTPDEVRVELAVPYVVQKASIDLVGWFARVVQVFLSSPAGLAAAETAAGLPEPMSRALKSVGQQGVNSYRFLKAAYDLGIPYREVVTGVHCFGTGRHSRWLDSSFTDSTSVIGARLARDKALAAQVLRQAGLPAPIHARVKSLEQAQQVAEKLGYPVVVKPADLDQGVGVAANLTDLGALNAAYAEALKYSPNILVEKHFAGDDYRLTVFNGRVVKITLRVPGGVEGDGVRSVAQLLVVAQNSAEQLRRAHERGKELLALDAEAIGLMEESGITPESVPAAGEYVCLRRRANLSAGGSARPVAPEAVHPDNAQLAIRAAAALRLDLAGIDLLIPDISRSWLEVGALICEVNGQPQIGIGTSPHIYGDILRDLLGPRSTIPVILVLGAAGHTSVWHEGLELPDRVVGVSSEQGVWAQGAVLTGRQKNGFIAGQILMTQSVVDAAIIVMNLDHIAREGLPFDRCDGVVLLGPGDAAPPWEESILRQMWGMVLPHVNGSIVLSESVGSRCLPGVELLARHGVSALIYPDVSQCVQQVRRHLEAVLR